MIRQAVAAVLILAILGVVAGLGVSGLLHIALVLAAALLTLLLVRSPSETAEKGSHR